MEDHEDGYSVNSPRRVLSFSKTKNQRGAEGRSNVFNPSSSVSGPKPSEVYGFVGIITTVVATVIFLAWAYVPESWLHSIGIYYYPNRYWALAMPTYGMVTVALGLTFYIGLNFISTPSPTSLSMVFDEFTREADEDARLALPHQQQAIKPISDIPVYIVNNLMFTDSRDNVIIN
ncbi:Phosphatidylinositol N-acetylglucosaminyltransferase subunit P [Linum grandiflorum]